ncbi:MAG: hypothetical protein V1800_15260 [Candidatus Latescibacterota bacterium]
MKTNSAVDARRHTPVVLSVMNARFYTAGSLANGAGNYLFSGRRGLLDKIRILSVVDDETSHFFHDMMGKVEAPLG